MRPHDRVPPTSVFQLFQGVVRYSGCKSSSRCGNSVLGKTLRSIPRCAPTKNGLISGWSATSVRAIAMPGYKCPPVPPPANTTRIRGASGRGGERIRRRAADDALAGAADVHNDAGEQHGEHEIRPPI